MVVFSLTEKGRERRLRENYLARKIRFSEMSNTAKEQTPSEVSPAASASPQVIVVQTVVTPVVVPVVIPVPVAVSAGAEKEPAAEFEEDVSEKESERSGIFQIEKVRSRPPGVFSQFWKKIGGTGFAASILFHFVLIVFALFYVFSALENPKPEASVFVSGSGGSSARRGESLSKKAFRKIPETQSPKIFAKSQNAKLVLPEMPKMPAMKMSDFAKKLGGEGGSAVHGNEAAGLRGFGGGVGLGAGIGIGDGKNHLGKFKTLLGAQIKAQKIAVFLDCSGSMKSFLPAVKAEIYEKFPDADIFAFSGAQTEIHDGEVVGGRAMKAKTLAALKRKRAEDETETAKLSGQGRVIYGKYSAHFAAGTLGAWLDVFLKERYDALVVFSDFRDGIRQRRGGKTVYADSSYASESDGRTERERSWEKGWQTAFSRKNAPKLYLFSVRSRPQAFFEKCVEASGGEITILNLKKPRRERLKSGD